MAKATARCTCATCGETFVKTRIFRSRKDADEYEEWAESCSTQCPACWAESSARRTAEKLSAYMAQHFGADNPLPEITEGSPKQITFANDLRERFILEKLDAQPRLLPLYRAADAAVKLDKLPAEKVAAAAEKEGLTTEEWFARHRVGLIAKRAGILRSDAQRIDLIQTSSSARNLIDGLINR